MLLDIMAGESYLLQEAIYSSGQTMVSYYNRTGIGQRRTMNTMANKGIMCRSTMGQDMPFGLKWTTGISAHISSS